MFALLCLALDETLNVCGNIDCVEVTRVPCHRFTFFVKEKFLEIPSNIVSCHGTPRLNKQPRVNSRWTHAELNYQWVMDIILESTSSGSQGSGSAFLKKINRGWASEPFTWTLPNKSALLSKLLPGRTCFKVLAMSPFSSLVWWPNWLQKTPKTFRVDPNWSFNEFMAWKSFTVVPQSVAQLRISVGFPMYLDILTSSPSSVFSENPSKDAIARLPTIATSVLIFLAAELNILWSNQIRSWEEFLSTPCD